MEGADVVLCDLDGVVWLSGTAIPGSVDAIGRLRAAGRRVVFVTNSSAVTIDEHTAALARIGVDATGDVVSSATAAAALLHPGERVLVCGGAGVAEAVEQAGATAVAGDDDAGVAAGIDAVVVGLHREFDYHRLDLALRATRGGARLIATNRDPLYPTSDGPAPGGGAIVAAVATVAGVEPVVAGKPHRPMALAVAALVGGDLADDAFRSRLLMVGDQVSTDGEFAGELGCRFALVRSGNTLPGAPVTFERSFDEPDLAAVADALLGVPAT
jgi:glycerol-1-phosphatase